MCIGNPSSLLTQQGDKLKRSSSSLDPWIDVTSQSCVSSEFMPKVAIDPKYEVKSNKIGEYIHFMQYHNPHWKLHGCLAHETNLGNMN